MTDAVPDLADFDTVAFCNDGADLEVVNPYTGKAVGITIRLLGPDSDLVQRLRRERQEQTYAAVRRPGGKPMDPEAVEKANLEFLSRITLGWSGFAENGTPVVFSQDEAYRIYRRYPFIREQVERFIGDRAHFRKG